MFIITQNYLRKCVKFVRDGLDKAGAITFMNASLLIAFLQPRSSHYPNLKEISHKKNLMHSNFEMRSNVKLF